MHWTDKNEENKFINLIEEISQTPNSYNSLTVTEDTICLDKNNQIILHFISLELVTF